LEDLTKRESGAYLLNGYKLLPYFEIILNIALFTIKVALAIVPTQHFFAVI